MVLAGRYRVGALLGEGGMGAVHEGTDLTLDRPVALKVMTGVGGDASAAERFFREAAAAAKLAHPHIVQVTDFCPASSEGAPAAIVMERLEGRTLAAETSHARLPPQRALAIASQCASALAAAHRAGLVHRDVKPANVFLVQTQAGVDVVKLLDFGIVKYVGAEHTTTGAVLGTIAYMSPEQAMGAADLGPPSDVWSLGVVLYEMLTGRLPVTGRTPGDIVASLVRGDLTPIAAVSPDLDPRVARLVDRALAIAPADRFPDASAMLAALEVSRADDTLVTTAVDDAPTRTTGATRLQRPSEARRPAPRPLLVAGGLVAALACAVAVGGGAALVGSRASSATAGSSTSSAPRPPLLVVEADAAGSSTPTAPSAIVTSSAPVASASSSAEAGARATPPTPSLGPWSFSTYRSKADHDRDLAAFEPHRVAVTACLRSASLAPCVGDSSPSMTLEIVMSVAPDTGAVRRSRLRSFNCWVGGRPRSPDRTELEACVARALVAASFGPPLEGSGETIEIWAPILWR